MFKIFILILLCVFPIFGQYNFNKVHNEKFNTPEERGFFFDLKCSGDTCISFNDIDGGFAKILISLDGGSSWDVSFKDINHFDNGQSISILGGGIYNNIIYYNTIGGLIMYAEDSFTNFNSIKTPIDYYLGRVDNCQIIDDNIYFTNGFTLFRNSLNIKDWEILHLFQGMTIVDLKVQNAKFYAILNNVDEANKDFKLNEKLFAISSDNGETWSINSIGFDVSVISLYENQIWLVGGQENGKGAQRDDVILFSSDDGESWEVSRFTISEKSGAGLHGIKMKDSNEGIAFGNNGNFLHTSNRGKSWERLSINEEIDNLGFKPSAIVLEWNKQGKPILGLSDQGIFLGDSKSEVEISKNSFNLYPNPFKDFVNIDIDNSLNKSYIIYDVNGNLIDSALITSTNFIVDLSSISSGAYFIKIGNRFERIIKK